MRTGTSWRRVAPVALWYSLTLATGICSPEILAALIKPAPGGLGLSISTAGLLLTVEMIANGAFGLAARLFDRRSSRSLIVAGFLTTLLANVATVGVSGLGPLIVLRILAGAGLGVVTIAVSRFVAASDNPDRLSSLLLVMSTLLSGAVLVAFGNSSPSATAVFLTLAGLAVLGLAALPFAAGSHATAAVVETPRSTVAATLPGQLPGLLIIVAAGLLNTADNGLYALTSVIGEHAGVGEKVLGYILTGAMISGVVAAIAAGRLRTAAGRSNGLVGSILVKACVSFAIVRFMTTGGFSTMAILSSFTLFFAMPLLLGASAHLDRRGRLVAQVSGVLQIGGALGPAWASGLAGFYGMRAVATVCAALLVVSALLCLMPLRIVRGLENAAPAT